MILKKEFYFIRHGQTDPNIGIIGDDHEDVSLNATGWKQARKIESKIATLPVKTVCFSPLKRVKETKEVITTRLLAEHCELSNLKECSREEWKKIMALGLNAQFGDQKFPKSFMQRVLKGINLALSQPGPVLVVAHGGVYWALCCLMGINQNLLIDNCVPVHFSVQENGQWNRKTL